MIQTALVQKAINAAIQSDWQVAVDLNLKILEQDPHNLDSLNRLARAYLELGDIAKSKKLYKEVISIDPYNVIALKNLKRFQLIKGNTSSVSTRMSKSSNNKSITTFIEEPGKTKVVQLVRPADPNTLFTLHSGERVKMVQKGRGIQFATEDDTYIGRLPDDLAFQVQFFIKNGNEYEAFIKQVLPNNVLVFIKETVRAAMFANRPSFNVSNESYMSASPEAAIEEGPEVFEEDEENSDDSA